MLIENDPDGPKVEVPDVMIMSVGRGRVLPKASRILELPLNAC